MSHIPDNIKKKIDDYAIDKSCSPSDYQFIKSYIEFGYSLSQEGLSGGRWVKASERLPEIENKKSLNIKYKGTPELLVCLNSRWCWAGNSFDESDNFPVDESSWSVIEWLDESQNL